MFVPFLFQSDDTPVAKNLDRELEPITQSQFWTSLMPLCPNGIKSLQPASKIFWKA